MSFSFASRHNGFSDIKCRMHFGETIAYESLQHSNAANDGWHDRYMQVTYPGQSASVTCPASAPFHFIIDCMGPCERYADKADSGRLRRRLTWTPNHHTTSRHLPASLSLSLSCPAPSPPWELSVRQGQTFYADVLPTSEGSYSWSGIGENWRSARYVWRALGTEPGWQMLVTAWNV